MRTLIEYSLPIHDSNRVQGYYSFQMRKFTSPLRSLASYFGIGFLLHLAWENLQAPLYINFLSYAQHFEACLRATATGDMFAMLLIYLSLAIIHQRLFWLTDKSVYRHPATWIIPIFIGVMIAVIFELRAVYATQSWQYTDTMPLVPFLQIGITPVLQMIIIPPLTILLTRKISAS